ncbi:hypothetical protein BKA70DRAFT_1433963 [Coprinopsis sp. MPI-PUGE-AT-0042]|nr:hypothetical protein BKA70DRAFT_1433963 [Coprinopsis sp. MPI-PUGE-AT-0042]
MPWSSVPKDVKEVIVSNLYLGDLQRLSAASTADRVLCKWEIRHRISTLVASFKLDPMSLLPALHQWRAVVGGSAALSIFTAGAVVPHDLNIYVPKGSMASFVASDAIRTQFSEAKDDNEERVKELRAFPGVYAAQHLIDRTGAVSITVIESLSAHAMVPILLSHSTIAMNFFSDELMFSAYPSLTMRCVGLNNSVHYYPTSSVTSWLNGMELHGMRMFKTSVEMGEDHTCHRSWNCTRTLRTIDDTGTLVFHFDEAAMQTSRVIDGTITWRLATVRTCRRACPRPRRMTARVTPRVRAMVLTENDKFYSPRHAED